MFVLCICLSTRVCVYACVRIHERIYHCACMCEWLRDTERVCVGVYVCAPESECHLEPNEMALIESKHITLILEAGKQSSP